MSEALFSKAFADATPIALSLADLLTPPAAFTPDPRFTAPRAEAAPRRWAGGRDLAPLGMADPRSEAPAMPRPEPVAAPVAQPPASDPATEAEARGHARGLAEGLARARAEAEADRAAQAALQLAFAHLDTQLAEQLRQRLTDTVVALCEHALAPLAVDEAALALRVRRAVAMLARADDERVICLHPADLTLVRAALPADWTFRPDPRLERGALRVETQGGGVEDGPREWRRAIAEALDIGGPEALEDEA